MSDKIEEGQGYTFLLTLLTGAALGSVTLFIAWLLTFTSISNDKITGLVGMPSVEYSLGLIVASAILVFIPRKFLTESSTASKFALLIIDNGIFLLGVLLAICFWILVFTHEAKTGQTLILLLTTAVILSFVRTNKLNDNRSYLLPVLVLLGLLVAAWSFF